MADVRMPAPMHGGGGGIGGEKQNDDDSGSDDYAALCAFARTTKGTGWNTDVVDIDLWSNIHVEDNRVVAIYFGGIREGSDLAPGKKLDGRLPEELWTLSMISRVLLRDTQLSGKIPAITTEHDLDHLQELDLSYNRLHGALPCLGLLPSLTYVKMHRNALTGTLVDARLEECKELQFVNLSMNHLTGCIPASFARLTKLQYLHLYSNQLSGIIPADFVYMESLQDFQIGHQAGLQLPSGTDYPGNGFKKWMDRRTKVSISNLKIAPPTKATWASLVAEGDQGSFPPREEQRLHREGALVGADQQEEKENGPSSLELQDKLDFDKYAEVLVERLRDPDTWPVSLGIYAQWGAGKSSLLRLILERFERITKVSEPSCFVRFLRSNILGSGFLEAWAGLRGCCVAKLCPPTDDTVPVPVPVTCILASFDAWLFADSDVLWAFLVSKIFDQVEAHPCFGKGAVRSFRLRKTSSEITMERLCFAAMGAVIVVGLAVALGLIIEATGGLDNVLTKALAFVGLAGVPISIVLWTIKALPAVFQGQGEVILNKAKSMHESVGSARLGFMADVQEEIQILLDMITDRSSTEKMKFALVVSIDNLDRCPHRNIVKVLEAVHLLLERDQTNVVVILALDPRVIISAIEADLGPEVRKEVSGSEYLDKIIHVPFCVPFGTQKQRLTLIDSWLGVTKGVTKSDENGSKTLEGGDGSSLCEPSSGKRPEIGTGDVRAASERAALMGDGSAAGGDPRGSAIGASVGGTCSMPEEVGGCAAHQRSAEQIVNPNPRSDSKTPDLEDQTTLSRSSSTAATDSRNSLRNVAGDDQVDSTGSSPFHIPGETDEFHMLCKEIVTTPRKMKRILNIYGIQRALAKEQTSDFRSTSARKLLRWAALCEFWPFRTACLVGSAKLAIDTREEDLGDKSAPLQFVYMERTSKVMKTMLNETKKVDDEPRSGGFSRSEVRRLLGMDESDQAFLRVLQATPLLCVGDFMEGQDCLGLLRFSFNLNPAMVATVGAWVRSEFS